MVFLVFFLCFFFLFFFWWIGVRLVLEEKGKKTITDSLKHTGELQAEIVMERSESSHRSWEPKDSRVLVERWPCWPGHARLPGLVLGKCVHCFGSRVLSTVLTYRNFLGDGNHYHSLIHRRQTPPALSSRKIHRQDRLVETKSDELLVFLFLSLALVKQT